MTFKLTNAEFCICNLSKLQLCITISTLGMNPWQDLTTQSTLQIYATTNSTSIQFQVKLKGDFKHIARRIVVAINMQTKQQCSP